MKFNYNKNNKTKESYMFLSNYLDVIDIKSFLNNDNLHQICVTDNDKLIAVSIFKIKNNKIHLNYTAIHKDYRRIKLNTKLKTIIINIAKQNNCKLITSNIRISNNASIKSHLKIGFKINNNYNLKYKNNEKKISMYLKLKY